MNWLDAVLHGAVLGLLLSVLIGPVFFLLLRLSIEQGVKQALMLDTGVIVGDVLYIWLSYIGTASIFINPHYLKPLGVIGSLILLITGTFPLIKKSPSPQKNIEIKTSKPVILIFKGFVLNVTNPFVIFFWIASTGYAVTTFDGNKGLIFFYFVSCLTIYTTIDLLKIYTAVRIRNYLTPTVLSRITIGSCAGIILIGLIMMYRVLKL